jgi:hypothetical protein
MGSEAVKKSKINRKDAKVQRNRKVNTLFARAFFASPLPLCASSVGVKAFFHKLSGLVIVHPPCSGMRV